jgi:hypothetical protein
MYIAVFKTDLVSLDVGVLSKLNPSNDIFTLSLFFSGLLSVVLARYSSAGLTKLVYRSYTKVRIQNIRVLYVKFRNIAFSAFDAIIFLNYLDLYYPG